MKLSTLKPALTALAPRLQVPRNMRHKGEPWRVWYSTRRWKRLRARVLLRDQYTCQVDGCGRIEHDTSRLIAHHKEPHKGNVDLFWNENMIETVCKTCHDSIIQSMEKTSTHLGTW